MFHPAIAAAVAQDRHTVMVKAADRRRSLRAIGRANKSNERRGR
jgi:(p)ppGpp synthase/HD superfamily hydrolase